MICQLAVLVVLLTCACAWAQPVITGYDRDGKPCRIGPGVQISETASVGLYEVTESIPVEGLPRPCPLGKMVHIAPIDADIHIHDTIAAYRARHPHNPMLAAWLARPWLTVWDVDRRMPCWIKRSPTMQSPLFYIPLTMLRPTPWPGHYRVDRLVSTSRDEQGRLKLVFNDRADAVLCPHGAVVTMIVSESHHQPVLSTGW